ncbi:hypothetical protein chiPu_0015561 [Chiloscyllium punctatum]|uniref:Uncharacterized protein n=1 Tax=Chiloscyllium punctatum TaxID=137246 RepID=A0A401T331_CHIPU|nr:hypothetical protein [Chiloscyllium punctatum]
MRQPTVKWRRKASQSQLSMRRLYNRRIVSQRVRLLSSQMMTFPKPDRPRHSGVSVTDYDVPRLTRSPSAVSDPQCDDTKRTPAVAVQPQSPEMEGNRDEAERCTEIGLNALKHGNREEALKFLRKAQKLYPSETVKSEYGGVAAVLSSG